MLKYRYKYECVKWKFCRAREWALNARIGIVLDQGRDRRCDSRPGRRRTVHRFNRMSAILMLELRTGVAEDGGKTLYDHSRRPSP